MPKPAKQKDFLDECVEEVNKLFDLGDEDVTENTEGTNGQGTVPVDPKGRDSNSGISGRDAPNIPTTGKGLNIGGGVKLDFNKLVDQLTATIRKPARPAAPPPEDDEDDEPDDKPK